MRLDTVDLGAGVLAGFTGSDANLSTVVGDTTAALEHRRALAALVGAPVAFVRQVHGASVLDVTSDGEGGAPALGSWEGLPFEALPAADALVAARPGGAVGVLVADCVPVLLADARAGVVAAVHAGRRGLAAGVVPAALARMARHGSRPADVAAAVGPAVCGRCYEVPAALRDEVDAQVPGTASTTSWGTPALDLPAGVVAQLEAAGVGAVTATGACTLEDGRWFSHRAATAGSDERPDERSGGGSPRVEGRFAGVVVLR